MIRSDPDQETLQVTPMKYKSNPGWFRFLRGSLQIPKKAQKCLEYVYYYTFTINKFKDTVTLCHARSVWDWLYIGIVF